MIETEQTIAIDAPIDEVWAYARNIEGWAKLMPGLQDCDIVDENNSRWTLKVGAGALVRTVKVLVQVDRWAGPEEVDFSYSLQGDPVKGGGVYRARSLGPNETEITLNVRVEGTGPMAPMWEAMGKPLLPKFARGFAEQFKAEIEQRSSGGATEQAETRSPGLLKRLFALLRRLFGRSATTM
jgi:uncharacterized membrane protein